MSQQRRVAMVGAGYICEFHLDALKRLPSTQITAICDVSRSRAEALASRYGVAHVFTSVEELLASGLSDCAHVAVPPDMHFTVAKRLLDGGLHVFLEKPMATSSADSAALVQAARAARRRIGVNHNYLHHPAFLAAKARLASSQFGRLHHLLIHWNVPLRQLAARQFGHWMFRSPGNILLEQAVHPLSQIADLLGPIRSLDAVPGGRRELAPGRSFYDTWMSSLDGERASGQFFFSVGQDFESYGMTLVCQDGQIVVDFVGSTCVAKTKTKWPDFWDQFVNGTRLSRDTLLQSTANARDYLLSNLRLKRSLPAFAASMDGSIRAFHAALDQDSDLLDGRFGEQVVQACEAMAARVPRTLGPGPEAPSLVAPAAHSTSDYLVIGGTGFIGTKVVQRLVREGKRVTVYARNLRLLSGVFASPRVRLVEGDIGDAQALHEAMREVPIVIHLAHGGGGNTWERVRETMVGGTRTVADACLQSQVKRLVYIGTIASLYLGDARDVVLDGGPNDPRTQERAFYSRAKAECEALLTQYREANGLPVCILRPGLVVGNGGSPFHSGLGLFNRDNHCIGWNRGRNPLPFVLVDDVSDAIVRACHSPQAAGKTYNVVGDVRLTAREYVDELSSALQRHIHFLPQPLWKSQCIEIAKWIVKVGVQRRKVPFPSLRDLRSRGLVAHFDTSGIKAELGWAPVSERAAFVRDGVQVYQQPAAAAADHTADHAAAVP